MKGTSISGRKDGDPREGKGRRSGGRERNKNQGGQGAWDKGGRKGGKNRGGGIEDGQ